MDCAFQYSVVATVFNDEKEILNLLNDINKQSYKPSEIIIVDGGSKDLTCHIINNYDKNIKLITGRRYNISQGLNVAIKNASCQWIGIVATGNSYGFDFFEKLIKSIQENEERYECAYGSKYGVHKTAFGKFYDEYFIHRNAGMPNNHGALICKSVFEQEGYFFENFVYAGEDAEFYRRVKKAGKNSKYVEDACIYWEGPQSYKEYFKQERRYGIGHMQMFTNRILLTYYRNDLIYTGFLFVMLLFLIMYNTRMAGVFMLSIGLAFNLYIIIRNSYGQCKAMNIRRFTRVICLLVNWKYLLNKYKIDKEYLINEVIK